MVPVRETFRPIDRGRPQRCGRAVLVQQRIESEAWPLHLLRGEIDRLGAQTLVNGVAGSVVPDEVGLPITLDVQLPDEGVAGVLADAELVAELGELDAVLIERVALAVQQLSLTPRAREAPSVPAGALAGPAGTPRRRLGLVIERCGSAMKVAAYEEPTTVARGVCTEPGSIDGTESVENAIRRLQLWVHSVIWRAMCRGWRPARSHPPMAATSGKPTATVTSWAMGTLVRRSVSGV